MATRAWRLENFRNSGANVQFVSPKAKENYEIRTKRLIDVYNLQEPDRVPLNLNAGNLPLTMAGGRLAERFANRRTDYAMSSDDPADLANSPDYATFLDRMERVFAELERVLRRGRYAAVIVRDAYQAGRYVFTSADLSARADRVGLVPKGDLIWYQAGTRLRPYGYPRSFVPNIAHQHILVFRAERPAGRAQGPTRPQPWEREAR